MATITEDFVTKEEKIRKQIKVFIKSRGSQITQSKTDAWLAWLEKQVEPNPYSGVSFKYNGHTWGMCARDNGVDILCDKHIIGHIEKQGNTAIKWNKNTEGNKPQVNHSVLMKTTHGIAEGEWQGEYWHQYRWAGIVRDSDVLSWVELSDLEKQDEQNPADKVEPDIIIEESYQQQADDLIDMVTEKPADKYEPKFKVGDWVVCNNGPHHIFQVIERSWPNAKYRNINGTEIFLNVNTLDKQYHLWTIQDAKDGDVLVCEDFGYTSIMLFKSFSNGRISLHCWYNSQTNNFHLNADVALRKDANIHPATKEQRDQLEKAIADAGYTFDFEKKELKKIKQDEWTEEDEKYSSYICAALDCYYRLREDRNNTNGQKNLDEARNWLYNKLKSLRPQSTWNPSDEQKEDSMTDKVQISDDLGEYINELSKQFPEVSFAKLSRIAVRMDKWQKEKMMKNAVETTFNVSLPSGLYDKLWIKGCKEGDKLLVIKKDEL